MKVCPTCHGKQITFPITINYSDLPDFNLLEHLAFPAPSVNKVWKLSQSSTPNQDARTLQLLYKIFSKIFSCRKISKIFSGGTDGLIDAYAQIFISFMQNYTVQYSSSQKLCDNGEMVGGIKDYPSIHSIRVKALQYIKKAFPFSYFRQDKFLSLHFVSCGMPVLDTIPFQELANVFDGWIWFCILVSIFAIIVPIFPFVSKHNLFCFHLMIPLKLFLEQGNPVPDSISKLKMYRHVLGSFLLMSVVISNAYKNKNVHTMISVRKPVPYEKMQELIRDNFKILGRTDHLKMHGWPKKSFRVEDMQKN